MSNINLEKLEEAAPYIMSNCQTVLSWLEQNQESNNAFTFIQDLRHVVRLLHEAGISESVLDEDLLTKEADYIAYSDEAELADVRQRVAEYEAGQVKIYTIEEAEAELIKRSEQRRLQREQAKKASA